LIKESWLSEGLLAEGRLGGLLGRGWTSFSIWLGRLPPGIENFDKLMICKNCNSFLVPGVNCRVRTHASRVVITCLDCGSIRRVPFVRERKSKLNKRVGEKS
jgi:hypothetical protein